MKNQCWIHARKSDANKNRKSSKIGSQRDPKSSKNPSQNLSTNEFQKHHKKEFQKEGRRQGRHPTYPPPPGRRGQGVPNAFADSIDSYRFTDSKASPGTPPLPPTLAPEILFSHIRLIFPFFPFFHFFLPIKNSSKIGPLSNLPKTSKIGPLGAQS